MKTIIYSFFKWDIVRSKDIRVGPEVSG